MRNLKAIGLALVAMLAISAAAAQVATADEFTAEKYPVTLTGAKDGAFEDVLTLTAGTAKCKQTNYSGTVEAPTTTVKVIPVYNECTAFGFPAVIDIKSCYYLFHINGSTSTEGTVDIECSTAGDEITITSIGAGTTKCVVHIKPQTNLGPVVYKNLGEGTTREVTVEVNIVNKIHYTHTEGTGVGKCTPGTGTTGSLSAKALITGEEDIAIGAAHIGIFLSNV